VLLLTLQYDLPKRFVRFATLLCSPQADFLSITINLDTALERILKEDILSFLPTVFDVHLKSEFVMASACAAVRNLVNRGGVTTFVFCFGALETSSHFHIS